jgi:hypothetical protein
MNKHPIESARDPDLRLSRQAMQRAAQRARLLAIQTGTTLVVSVGGVIRQIHPEAEAMPQTTQEPPTPDGEKPHDTF